MSTHAHNKSKDLKGVDVSILHLHHANDYTIENLC